MTSSPIRVMLVEDHALVREGTVALLAAYPDLVVVGSATDAPAALRLILELRPDVVVLDIRIPGGGGAQVASRAAHAAPGTRVLALSAYGQADYVAAMRDAGVAGYLLKSATGDELAAAIRGVHAGRRVFDPALEEPPPPSLRRVSEAPPDEPLTLREFDVLRHLAAGSPNKTIAAELGLSSKTVEAHLSRIYSKLRVRSRTEAVVRAARAGLIAVDHGTG